MKNTKSCILSVLVFAFLSFGYVPGSAFSQVATVDKDDIVRADKDRIEMLRKLFINNDAPFKDTRASVRAQLSLDAQLSILEKEADYELDLAQKEQVKEQRILKLESVTNRYLGTDAAKEAHEELATIRFEDLGPASAEESRVVSIIEENRASALIDRLRYLPPERSWAELQNLIDRYPPETKTFQDARKLMGQWSAYADRQANQQLKNALRYSTNYDQKWRRLQGLVREFPRTDAAATARQLLANRPVGAEN